MNVREAAERLNRSENTIRNWIKMGRIESRLTEGIHGPEHHITEEAVDKARESHRTPVIIQSNEPAVPVAEMQRMVESSMTSVLADRISGMMDIVTDRMDGSLGKVDESIGRMHDAMHRMEEAVSGRIASLQDGIDIVQAHAELKSEIKRKDVELAALREENAMLRGTIEGLKHAKRGWFSRS
jgi:transposase-like protein